MLLVGYAGSGQVSAAAQQEWAVAQREGGGAGTVGGLFTLCIAVFGVRKMKTRVFVRHTCRRVVVVVVAAVLLLLPCCCCCY